MSTALDRPRSNGVDGEHIDAIGNLPPHLAIMRMENDSIQSLAAAHPRDFVAIKESLADLLTAFPVLATEAIYNKPVGRDNDTCGDCGKEVFRKKGKMADSCFSCRSTNIIEGAMKYARNLSVRAAETLSEAYGFNRVRSDATVIDEDTVKVEATFTDYQRGRIWQDGGIVSRNQKRRDGTTERVPDDRFYNVVLKAEKSKYVREVINRSINAGLKAWFWEECEKITDKLLDDKTVEKIVGQFSGKGVNVQKLERLLGRPLSSGWTQDDRKTLLGVWNAIKDGETTIAEAFDMHTESADTSGGRMRESSLNEEIVDEQAREPASDPIDDSPSASDLATVAEQLGCPQEQCMDWADKSLKEPEPEAFLRGQPWRPARGERAKKQEQGHLLDP